MNSTAVTGDPGPNGEEDQEESTREMADRRQMREGDSKKEAGQNIRSGSTAPGNRDQERRGEERGAPKGPGETQATGALPLIK